MSGSMMASFDPIDAYDGGNLAGTPIQNLEMDGPPQNNSSEEYMALYNEALRQEEERSPTCVAEGQTRATTPVHAQVGDGPVRSYEGSLSMKEMSELASEIGKGFDEEMIIDTESEEEPNEQSGYLEYIPTALKEPLAIVAIFVFLSHPKVKTAIGKYIKQINPTDDCQVPFSGVVIYGIILATIYHFVKKYIIS